MDRGTLVLVVGASGSGKDTLIAGARAALDMSGDFRFPRREITRSADAGGEDHQAVDPTQFLERRAAGAYSLSWTAHGLYYGVPRSIDRDLAAGRHVVVNVSRAVVAEARRSYRPLKVINIHVATEILQARLHARARESEHDIRRRLARAVDQLPDGPDVVRFENDAPIARSVPQFVALLNALVPASGNRRTMVNGAPGAS